MVPTNGTETKFNAVDNYKPFFPYPKVSKPFPYSNALLAKPLAQTLFKSVTDKTPETVSITGRMATHP